MTEATQEKYAGQQIQRRAIEQLFQHGLTNILGTLFSVGTISICTWVIAPELLHFEWIGMMVLLSILRYVHLNKFNSSKSRHTLHLKLLMLGILVSALLWGYAATLLIPIEYFELRMLILLFIGALAAGTAVTYAPHYQCFLLFNITLFSIVVLGSLADGRYGMAISLQAGMFFVILLGFGHHLHKSFVNKLLMESENLSLIDELQQQQKKLEEMNELLEERVQVSGSALAAANQILERELDEKNRIEKDLLTNQEMLDAAFEFAPTAMALVHQDGTILNVNRESAKMSGWSIGELIGMSIMDVTVDDYQESSLGYHQSLFAGDIDNYTIERKFKLKDGSNKWIELRASLVRDSDGKPLYKIAHIIDIDDKKKAQLDLIQTNENFKKAVQVANLGVWEWGEVDESMKYCNQEYADLFEMTVDEIMAQFRSYAGFLEMVHPEDREYLVTVESDADEKLELLDFEYRIVTKSGKIRQVHEISDVTYDENGEVTGAFGVLREMKPSELKRVS